MRLENNLIGSLRRAFFFPAVIAQLEERLPCKQDVRGSIPRCGSTAGTVMAWSKVSRHKRGYGTAHDKARKLLFAQEPLCRACASIGRVSLAHIADHIVNLASGGTGDMDNMQPLCIACHDDKTAREAAASQGRTYTPRRLIAEDGWPV